jgi:hypothetical protein
VRAARQGTFGRSPQSGGQGGELFPRRRGQVARPAGSQPLIPGNFFSQIPRADEASAARHDTPTPREEKKLPLSPSLASLLQFTTSPADPIFP